MIEHENIAVTSRSFSKNSQLRMKLSSHFSNVKFNESGVKLVGRDLIDFLKGSSRAIIALENIDDDVLSALPELKIISKYGVGLDSLDLESMHKRGVQLGWTPGVNSQSVAELAVSFFVSSLRYLNVANHEIKKGHWRQIVGRQLSSVCVGLIGYGQVGRKVRAILKGYGTKVVFYDIKNLNHLCDETTEQVSLDNLLKNSDIVSLHIPMNQKNENFLSAEHIYRMKKNSILVNTARGGIVDEIAVYDALIEENLSAAAFDVFKEEPPINNKLMTLPQVSVSPHLGGSSSEAILNMGIAAIEGLLASKKVDDYEY